jgi:hypothetical protein
VPRVTAVELSHRITVSVYANGDPLVRLGGSRNDWIWPKAKCPLRVRNRETQTSAPASSWCRRFELNHGLIDAAPQQRVRQLASADAAIVRVDHLVIPNSRAVICNASTFEKMRH